MLPSLEYVMGDNIRDDYDKMAVSSDTEVNPLPRELAKGFEMRVIIDWRLLIIKLGLVVPGLLLIICKANVWVALGVALVALAATTRRIA
jgi:hypothetical protein